MKKRILGLTMALVMLFCSFTAFANTTLDVYGDQINPGDSITISAQFDNYKNRTAQVVITDETVTPAIFVAGFEPMVDSSGNLNFTFRTSENLSVGTYTVSIYASAPSTESGAAQFKVVEPDTDSDSSGSGSGSGGGTYGGGLIVPIGNVVTTPIPPSDVPQFADVEGHWAVGPIMQLASLGIIKGYGDGTFGPEDLVTREQFVTMLVNAFGYYDASAVCHFNDVDVNAWYYRYVASGVVAQITRGMGDVFGIGMNITREEMATMCYRLVQNGRVNATPAIDRFDFADMEFASDWAHEPILTMRETGLIQGIGDNMFAPKAPSTRAQAAQIIYNLLYGTSISQ